MQKWEYLVVDTHNAVQLTFGVMEVYGDDALASMKGQDITRCLHHLGEEGWELVFCHQLKAFSIVGQRYVFKRPNPEPPKD